MDRKHAFRVLLAVVFLAAILALLIGNYSEAGADSSDVWVTSTWTPFGNSCPTGFPTGWGTYTPSPLWWLDCGYCFASASPTVASSPTVTVTGTLPTTTSTPAPTSTFASYYTFDSWTLGTGDTRTCGSIANGFYCDFDIVSPSGLPTLNWTRTATSASVVVIDATATGEFNYPYDPDLDGQHDIGFSTGSYPAIGTGVLVHYSYTVPSNKTQITTYWSSHGSHSHHWWGRIYVFPGSAQSTATSTAVTTATLTPTITTTPEASVCTDMTPANDFWWELFEPDGEPNCSMGWEEFTVGDTVVPGVTICLQPVIVGVVGLFGTEYNMDILFLALLAAFVWRFMRTA